MAGDSRGRKLRVDADGVRIEKLPGVRGPVWLVVAVIGLVGVALLLRARPAPEGPSERAAAPPPQAARSDAGAVAPAVPPVVEPRRRAPVPPPAAADAPAPPAAAVAAQHAAQEEPMFGQTNPGEPSGVALFPPLGTEPIRRGLLVPEDFQLPPGYVRHYQATDDGERVPAILMFHPDYQPVDAQGEPIALPADRVVPPDLAPPGMPVEMLELPEDQGAPDGAP